MISYLITSWWMMAGIWHWQNVASSWTIWWKSTYTSVTILYSYWIEEDTIIISLITRDNMNLFDLILVYKCKNPSLEIYWLTNTISLRYRNLLPVMFGVPLLLDVINFIQQCSMGWVASMPLAKQNRTSWPLLISGPSMDRRREKSRNSIPLGKRQMWSSQFSISSVFHSCN
jgi:hypothetical protein